MDNRLQIKIRYEIDQIDRLLENAYPLIKTLNLKTPDFVELSAAGSVLHSFYNGVENIFSMIEKHYGLQITESSSWHKELLKNIQTASTQRQPIISGITASGLSEYMMFRHFYRHAYGFQLDWEKMKHLVFNLTGQWKTLKTELNSFLN